MVMPRSRSMSPLSMTRSATTWLSRNAPLWRSIASTRVVLPWSTWAMMATLRKSLRIIKINPLYFTTTMIHDGYFKLISVNHRRGFVKVIYNISRHFGVLTEKARPGRKPAHRAPTALRSRERSARRTSAPQSGRSEERRVGKERRARWSQGQAEKREEESEAVGGSIESGV